MAVEGNGNDLMPIPEYDATYMYGFFRQYAPQFRISADDLNNPKPEVVSEIYRWFVKSLTNCKEGTLESVSIDGEENPNIEFPQLHEASIPLLKLSIAVDSIFTELGFIQYITIQDLIHPVKKRTHKCISILIDFFKFVKSREKFVTGCLNDAKSISEERKNFVKRNNELKERIHAIRIEKQQHEPELNKLKARKEAVVKKLKERNKIVQNIQKEDELILNEEKFLKSALNSLKEQKEALIEKDKILASQIVSSPEKLAAELEELKRNKLEKETQLELFNSNINELVEKQKDFPRVEALLDNLLTSVKKISDEIDKRDVLGKKQEDLAEIIGSLRLKIDDATRTLNGRREISISRCDQLTKLKQQQNLRLADYQNEISQIKERISSLEQEINESEIVSSDFEEQCRNLRKEINKIEREHDELVARFNEKHEKLMAALDKMNKNAVEYYEMISKDFDEDDDDEAFDASISLFQVD